MNNYLRKFYYGDIPEEKGGAEIKDSSKNPPLGGRGADWPLWEVFIRSKQGLDHKHVGSLHAADAQMAIENAPEEAGELFEPAEDKIYRHPTFYQLPDEVNQM